MISASEKERYQRQLLINGWGLEAQEKLKHVKVFVGGAGGLGSPLLMYLAVAGVGVIRICDFDTVDISNLNRQVLHGDLNIGMYKVDSALKKLRELNPHVSIITIRDPLTKRNAAALVDDSDMIIDCLDNFKARHILNQVSVNKRIPFIHAGVSGMQGQISFLHPPHTPCLSCFYPAVPKKERFPILGATAGVIGTMQSMEALKYFTGIGENLMNRILFWDGSTMQFEIIKILKNPKCPVCGKI